MSIEFDKSIATFPIKKRYTFLNSCGVSPLYSGALRAEQKFSEAHAEYGNLLFREYPGIRGRIHKAVGDLLLTSPSNISFTKNSAEPINLIAAGYPFKPGDEIVSYAHEYPSNYYPWFNQKKRGVVLKLVQDSDSVDGVAPVRPRAFSLKDLEDQITPRTRIIAISHVQFTSGFAADLFSIGKLCKALNIDLVVDAAQSLGALPLYPEQLHISAVIASGWKWLMGPIGTGILYTTPEFRKKIALTHVGPDLMKQGDDYLNYTWNPVEDGGKFECSSLTYSVGVGLEAAINEMSLKYGVEKIAKEIFRLQDLFLGALKSDKVTPIVFPHVHRSGILSLVTKEDPQSVVKYLEGHGIVCTVRGGYLRIAPQFYTTDEEILRVADVLNHQ